MPYDRSSYAGLAFVGTHVRRINVNAVVDTTFQTRFGIAMSEILKSYLNLLQHNIF